jgi:hypothetical protein
MAKSLELLPGRYFKLGSTPRSYEEGCAGIAEGKSLWRQEPTTREDATNVKQLFLFWSVPLNGWLFSEVLDMAGKHKDHGVIAPRR